MMNMERVMNVERIVDSHFHIWDFPMRGSFHKTDASFDWPDSSLPKIHRDILAPEAEVEMQKSGVGAAVFVQCLNSCPEEVAWLASLASQHSFIKGVVGGLDLTQDQETLRTQIRQHGDLLVGVRHILDVEEDDWLLLPEVARGLQVLEQEGKVFDCLVRPPTLKHVATIAKQFPSLHMVVDHIAKPLISKGTQLGLKGWSEDMASAAACPNVYCKLSGLVTEADPDHYTVAWSAETFRPYTQHCLELFGANRCMFGSDWPVCKLAGAEHEQVVGLLRELVSHLGPEDRDKVFYSTARDFYKLKL